MVAVAVGGGDVGAPAAADNLGRTLDVGAVLVHQIDHDGPRGRAACVVVRHGTVGGVGDGAAVAPVDDVRRDRVGARVGDGTQRQRVGGALVDAGVAADGDGWGHVVD